VHLYSDQVTKRWFINTEISLKVGTSEQRRDSIDLKMSVEKSGLQSLQEKLGRFVKPGLVVTCLLVILLSIIGSATSSSSSVATTRGLFLGILVIMCLAATVAIVLRVARSSGQSKYQINEKRKKTGEINDAFDEEKGSDKTKDEEKDEDETWKKSYVPYEKSGDPMDNVVFTSEKTEESVLGENKHDLDNNVGAENDEDKYKKDYESHDEKEDGKEKEDVQEKEIDNHNVDNIQASKEDD